ncbi:hypothetical protein LINPERPRIM_LOCUS20392, partial [Linum perenne]
GSLIFPSHRRRCSLDQLGNRGRLRNRGRLERDYWFE